MGAATSVNVICKSQLCARKTGPNHVNYKNIVRKKKKNHNIDKLRDLWGRPLTCSNLYQSIVWCRNLILIEEKTRKK